MILFSMFILVCLFIFTLFAMVPQHHWLRRSLKIFQKPPHKIISFRDVTTLIHTGLQPLSLGELSPVGFFGGAQSYQDTTNIHFLPTQHRCVHEQQVMTGCSNVWTDHRLLSFF